MFAWPQDMTLPAAIGGLVSTLAVVVWMRQRARRKRVKEARERELEKLRRR